MAFILCQRLAIHSFINPRRSRLILDLLNHRFCHIDTVSYHSLLACRIQSLYGLLPTPHQLFRLPSLSPLNELFFTFALPKFHPKTNFFLCSLPVVTFPSFLWPSHESFLCFWRLLHLSFIQELFCLFHHSHIDPIWKHSVNAFEGYKWLSSHGNANWFVFYTLLRRCLFLLLVYAFFILRIFCITRNFLRSPPELTRFFVWYSEKQALVAYLCRLFIVKSSTESFLSFVLFFFILKLNQWFFMLCPGKAYQHFQRPFIRSFHPPPFSCRLPTDLTRGWFQGQGLQKWHIICCLDWELLKRTSDRSYQACNFCIGQVG